MSKRTKRLIVIIGVIVFGFFLYSRLSFITQISYDRDKAIGRDRALAEMQKRFPPAEPCNQEKVYDDLVRVMGELGDMKEICGHIEDIEYIIACRYPYGSFSMYSCQSAAEEIEEIDSWLTQYRFDLNVSCIKDKACRHWAQTALSWDYRLILE